MKFIVKQWTEADRVRFWEKVLQTKSIHECWLWQAATCKGYGAIGWRDAGVISAHRVAYGLRHNTDLQTSDEIMHLCNNPRCCNPYHLYKGTHAENMEHTELFSPEQVRYIRTCKNSARSLAKDFNCSHTTINKIRSGRRYSSIA